MFDNRRFVIEVKYPFSQSIGLFNYDEKKKPSINPVVAIQKLPNEIGFDGYEVVGNKCTTYQTRQFVNWQNLNPNFFGLALFPKSVLEGKKLEGEFVIDWGNEYIIFGILPHDNLRKQLRNEDHISGLESVVYVPREMIKGLSWRRGV